VQNNVEANSKIIDAFKGKIKMIETDKIEVDAKLLQLEDDVRFMVQDYREN